MEKTIHTETYRDLIAWLKSCRERKGISMRELAVQLNVSHSWVAKVEQNERRLDLLEYVRLCNSLGVNPSTGLTKIKSALKDK
ncbi:helix-turn-helix transcriptional regulator [Gammaproteobacteria bacterium AH-315-K14]|nr:helix-turn-helix transcriptional regulator [Gammaproteobacteria bacterium AH-315-K14]